MKTLSEPAQAAKLIRAELKKAFPGVKFSVTSDCTLMCSSVDISYNADIQKQEIRKITDKYKRGHFDGMTDSYEFTNKNDLPKVYYVQISGY